MPLSEDEQRILHEIERSFYEHDPDFAKGVSQTTLSPSAGRNTKWAVLGFVGGFVLLVLSFAASRLLALAAFLLMVSCALMLERNLRRLGKSGWSDLTQSVRDRGFPTVLGDTRKRLGKRFKRDENPPER